MHVGPFKCYVMQWGVGGTWISTNLHYEDVWSNVNSVTRGWGCQILGKKRYVTLECPLGYITDIYNIPQQMPIYGMLARESGQQRDSSSC